jgi:excisionase family DNA binding protein
MLDGSNRMLPAGDVPDMLGVPERTVRDKWPELGLPAYRIGKHLRCRERDVLAWIDRQTTQVAQYITRPADPRGVLY